VHTGQPVTRDDILGHTHEFAPTVDKLTVIGEGPLKVDPTGHYTDPQPGKAPDREFWAVPRAAQVLRRLRLPYAGPAACLGGRLHLELVQERSESTRAPVHCSRPCQVHRDPVDPGGQGIVLADVTARSWKVEVDASKRDY
jgi:hypothetical protein